jgi:hypothetical protein
MRLHMRPHRPHFKTVDYNDGKIMDAHNFFMIVILFSSQKKLRCWGMGTTISSVVM